MRSLLQLLVMENYPASVGDKKDRGRRVIFETHAPRPAHQQPPLALRTIRGNLEKPRFQAAQAIQIILELGKLKPVRIRDGSGCRPRKYHADGNDRPSEMTVKIPNPLHGRVLAHPGTRIKRNPLAALELAGFQRHYGGMSRQQLPRNLFCFGIGYTALTLSHRLMAEGVEVQGTCRSHEKQTWLAGQGVKAWLFDRGRPLSNISTLLGEYDAVLISIPPDSEGDPVHDLYGSQIAAMPYLKWLGYLSTTGVYGNRDGGLVDETSEIRPSGARGQRRAAAETAWQALAHGNQLPLHIFRLAGIYGPGRNALVNLIQGSARRIDAPGQIFSRAHVADIATVLEGSMRRPNPGAIYNVCDDLPSAPTEVVEFAASLLNRPPPPLQKLEDANLSAMARSFYLDNKRVSNQRMKEELQVTLRYPDYRIGLRALLQDLQQSGSEAPDPLT